MRADGTIRPEEIYTQAEFKRRADMGQYAFRQARGDGLRTVTVGKKIYVRGIDFVEFVNRKADEDTKGNSSQSPSDQQ